MRSFPASAIQDEDLFDSLCKGRPDSEAHTLVQLRLGVFARYAEYIGSAALHSIPQQNYTDIQASALRDMFSRLSGRKIRDVIMASSKRCYLCNSRDSSELDHFLPKEEYPEFSAYSKNLIPSCHECNNKKGRRFISAAGGAMFFHPFKAVLDSSEPFLIAELCDLEEGVTFVFHIVQTSNMTLATYNSLREQFSALGLQEHYGYRAQTMLQGRMVAIRDEGSLEHGNVASYLRREADSQENRWGKSHWKVAALRAMADSEDFCTWGYERVAYDID